MRPPATRGIRTASVTFIVVLIIAGLSIWLTSDGSDGSNGVAQSTTTRAPATSTPGSTTILSTTSTALPPVGAEDLVGEYRGRLTREDEPGTPETFHVVSVSISEEGDHLAGSIIYGPVGAGSLDRLGSVMMPLDVTVEGDRLTMQWDESMGSIVDTTSMMCIWEAWTMNLAVEEGGHLLVLIDGFVAGRLPENTDVSEWYIGCPAGERAILRLTLVRQ